MATPQQMAGMARRWNDEVMNEHDADAADGFVTDDFVSHNPSPGFPPDKKGMIESLRALFAAFPDVKSEVEDIIAEGDRVAIRTRMTGTHTGEFMGIPATGKTVSAEGIDIVRMNEEGQGIEHWGLMDQMSMMTQLGLMEPPG